MVVLGERRRASQDPGQGRAQTARAISATFVTVESLDQDVTVALTSGRVLNRKGRQGMLNRDFEEYERAHELVKLSDGRYTCNLCRLQWKRKPGTFCAGVPVYRYGVWPEGLYTYTQLRRDRSMQPVNREEPQGCSFLRKSPYRRWLYHIDQSVHRRAPTALQREGIAKMRAGLVARYTCEHCGDSDYTHGQGRYEKKVDRYSGLCDACERLKYRREKQALVAEWAHEHLEMADFVVVDSETTGLNEYKEDEIIELAIVHSSGAILFSSLIQTQDPGRIDMATYIHGITQKILSEAPTFQEVWPTIKAILQRYRRVLVYNALFDCDLLETTVPRPNSWPNWSSISWPRIRLKRLLALIISSNLHFSETHILTVSSILPLCHAL